MEYEKLTNLSLDFEKQFLVNVTDRTDINIIKQIERLENDLKDFNKRVIMY